MANPILNQTYVLPLEGIRQRLAGDPGRELAPQDLRALGAIAFGRLGIIGRTPANQQTANAQGAYPVKDLLYQLSEGIYALAMVITSLRASLVRVVFNEIGEETTRKSLIEQTLMLDREVDRNELDQAAKMGSLLLFYPYMGKTPETDATRLTISTLINHFNILNHLVDLAGYAERQDTIGQAKLLGGITPQAYDLCMELFATALGHYIQIRSRPKILTLTTDRDVLEPIVFMAAALAAQDFGLSTYKPNFVEPEAAPVSEAATPEANPNP